MIIHSSNGSKISFFKGHIDWSEFLYIILSPMNTLNFVLCSHFLIESATVRIQRMCGTHNDRCKNEFLNDDCFSCMQWCVSMWTSSSCLNCLDLRHVIIFVAYILNMLGFIWSNEFSSIQAEAQFCNFQQSLENFTFL